MTEPITNFGGVKFNTDEIRSKTTEIVDGQLKYSVFFKNGIKLSYPQQETKQNASSNGFIEPAGKVSQTFRNIYDAEIYGTKYNEDNLFLQGCMGCKVDVKDEYDKYDTPKRDIVIESKSREGRVSAHNQILTDEHDLHERQKY